MPPSEAQDGEAEDIFGRLEGRWVLQILVALSGGHMRFSGLRRAIPKVSANLLTIRLRELEEAGLVTRSTQPPPGSYQAYELGPVAQSLRPALDHLDQWKRGLTIRDL